MRSGEEKRQPGQGPGLGRLDRALGAPLTSGPQISLQARSKCPTKRPFSLRGAGLEARLVGGHGPLPEAIPGQAGNYRAARGQYPVSLRVGLPILLTYKTVSAQHHVTTEGARLEVPGPHVPRGRGKHYLGTPGTHCWHTSDQGTPLGSSVLWSKAKVWGGRQTWVQVPAPSLNACVTLVMSHSEPHLKSPKMGVVLELTPVVTG